MAPKSNQQKRDDLEIALMAQDIKYIKEDVHDMKASMSSGFVSKDEFLPIRNIVYGFVSLALIAVIGALMSLVVK